MELLEIAPGTEIFPPGATIDQAYWIRTGEVELYSSTGRRSSVNRLLTVGDVFGEQALLSNTPQTLGARAKNQVILLPLSRESFLAGVAAHPNTFCDYLRILLAQLSFASPQTSTKLATPLVAKRKEPPKKLVVTLNPLTRAAAATLPEGGLRIENFPFKLGRSPLDEEELPKGTNDLWLNDQKPFNVSRQHAQIEQEEEDRFIFRDCNSSLGCYVNDEHIGTRSSSSFAQLDPGDNVVILGGRMSPYQFRIQIGPE